MLPKMSQLMNSADTLLGASSCTAELSLMGRFGLSFFLFWIYFWFYKMSQHIPCCEIAIIGEEV